MKIRILAALMRAMPTGIRRVAMAWRKSYSLLGGGGFSECDAVDSVWPAGVQPAIRGKKHRKLMYLDLQDWAERRAYFSGRYYQQGVEELLQRILRPGDQFIDIGANIGMTSLIAASRVGPTGRGFAFEPNPAACQRLRKHFEVNALSNFTIVPHALGDEPGTATLSTDGRHTGTGTMTLGGASDGKVLQVEVGTGSALAEKLVADRPTVIKIDVEGYEHRVLSGMPKLLGRPDTMLVVEVTDHLLARVGSSSQGLHDLLDSYAFESYLVQLVSGRWKARVTLGRLGGAANAVQYDALFVRPCDKIFKDRVLPLL